MNMDDFYANLFGSKPKKRGTGYELITAAVLQHLNKRALVAHDVFLKSTFSDDKHQLDGLVEVGQKTVVVEAKDHIEQDAKVGRPEVSKLAGSLLVLKDIDGAVFASATDFTNPAIQYSKDLKQANATPIDLYTIRPLKEGDDDNIISRIILNLHVIFPNYRAANWEPVLKPEAQEICKNIGFGEGDNVNVRMDGFYREDGSLIESLANLTAKLICDDEKMIAEGTWEFDEDTFIYINETLIPIFHLNYNIPYASDVREIRIEAGEPVIFVQAIDGSVDTLISFEDLKTAHEEVNKGGVA